MILKNIKCGIHRVLSFLESLPSLSWRWTETHRPWPTLFNKLWHFSSKLRSPSQHSQSLISWLCLPTWIQRMGYDNTGESGISVQGGQGTKRSFSLRRVALQSKQGEDTALAAAICSSFRRALTRSPFNERPTVPPRPSLSLGVFILWNRTAAARFKSVTVYNNSYW